MVTLGWITPYEEPSRENPGQSGFTLSYTESYTESDIKAPGNTGKQTPKTQSSLMFEEIDKHCKDKRGNRIIQADRCDCIELLEGRSGMTPPLLTPLTLQPLTDWLDRHLEEWAKAEGEFRPYLKTILRKRRWETDEPVGGKSDSAGGRPSPPADEAPRMCKCGRGPEISEGTPMCSLCYAQTMADIEARKAKRAAGAG
jgi:hypothetical protein